MTNCKNCGNQLVGNENVCPQCGTPVERAAAQPVVDAGVQPQVDAGVQPQVAQPQVAQTATGLPKDNLGLAGFICGIVGFLCCTYVAIPGLICSIMSMNNVKAGKVDPKNKWMGIVGLVLSILGIVIMIFNIINMVNGTNEIFNAING